MNELIENLLDLDPLYKLIQIEGVAYLFTLLILFVIAKLTYDVLTPFKVNKQLTEVDNKAIAVSFSGYMLGVAIVIFGVMSTEPAGMEETLSKTDFYKDLLATVLWGILGILLLNIARVINDKLLLSKFDNTKELVEDKNVGTGAVLWGSYVGSSLIIRSAIMGEDNGILDGIISTIVYFVIGQLGFIIFAWLYQKISRYDLHAEIERDNVSAGVAFGLNMTAIAILLSGYIIRYDSLPGFLGWFILSLFFIIVSRYIVDKFILPGALLDDEISKDQNWGAALIEGGIAIGIALLLVPVFLD